MRDNRDPETIGKRIIALHENEARDVSASQVADYVLSNGSAHIPEYVDVPLSVIAAREYRHEMMERARYGDKAAQHTLHEIAAKKAGVQVDDQARLW